MAGKVRAWRSKHIFVAVALLGSASVVSSSRERRLFSGSRWARARPGLAADVSRGTGRGDGESTPATSDGSHDAFVSDPRKGDDTAAPPCDAPQRVHEVREGAASAAPKRVWDEYILRGNDLPQTIDEPALNRIQIWRISR